MMRMSVWLLVLSLAVIARAQTPNSVNGHWVGLMTREGAQIDIRFDFRTNAEGALTGEFSSATQRALGIPLDTVTQEGQTFHAVLVGTTVFDGSVRDDEIVGSFRDRDGSGTFKLTKQRHVPPPYDTKEVQFRNNDANLAGSLLVPGEDGPHPAVVFNHGSGPEGRFASRFYADLFARNGIAALIYDKRGVGNSTGDWRAASFEVLADDALAGIRLLKRDPRIDDKRIGIYGHSQGGTIAPLIASRSADVSFIVAAAAIGMPVYEQDLFRVRNGLTGAGFSEDQVNEAMAFYSQWVDVALTGEGWPELESASRQKREKEWFKRVQPPERDNWIWDWYPSVGSFDGISFWEEVQAPVLLIYGEHDRNTPVGPSIRNIERALRKAGNSDYTIIILPRAAHNLTVRPEPGAPFEWWRISPGYPRLLLAWVQERSKY